ncbi:MAG: hypothetical protein U1E39_11345 [Planctomycetota bacterium]
MGYRPYVPADPAKGLRPGTSLPAAPTALPARRGLRVPEAYRRRAARFRGVVAADLVTIVGTAVAAASDVEIEPVGKGIFVAAFAGAGAIGLALACLSLDRFPLRLRASSGWVLGLPLIVACATIAREAPALAVGFAVTGLVQAFGSIVVREAIGAADLETSRSHAVGHAGLGPRVGRAHGDVPAVDAADGDGARGIAVRAASPALRALRGAVFAGGCAWVLGGLVEATHRNWWLGILATGLGVLAIRRAPDVGLTATDARVPSSDRGNPLAWVVVPLGGLAMLARAGWLLGLI